MKYEKQDIDGLTQVNKVLKYTNTAVMMQLAQLTADMGEMQ